MFRSVLKFLGFLLLVYFIALTIPFIFGMYLAMSQ